VRDRCASSCLCHAPDIVFNVLLSKYLMTNLLTGFCFFGYLFQVRKSVSLINFLLAINCGMRQLPVSLASKLSPSFSFFVLDYATPLINFTVDGRSTFPTSSSAILCFLLHYTFDKLDCTVLHVPYVRANCLSVFSSNLMYGIVLPLR